MNKLFYRDYNLANLVPWDIWLEECIMVRHVINPVNKSEILGNYGILGSDSRHWYSKMYAKSFLLVMGIHVHSGASFLPIRPISEVNNCDENTQTSTFAKSLSGWRIRLTILIAQNFKNSLFLDSFNELSEVGIRFFDVFCEQLKLRRSWIFF